MQHCVLHTTMIVKSNDMNQKTIPQVLTRCPVENTVALIGGKWKPYVLFNLSDGPKRFSELKRNIPDVSDRMLTRALRELEADQLVTREVIAQVPVKVIYTLTGDGALLLPILDQMVTWTRNRAQA